MDLDSHKPKKVSTDAAPRPAVMPQVQETTDHALVLTKGTVRYVFRCEPGLEHELLHQLAEQVRDPASPLDWFDAAVLSHHMGQRMKTRLKQLKAG